MFFSNLLLSSSFTPLSFFAASEPGAWYDPSDLTTLFQDSAGTTPVTAVEQPVGKILDKSGRGNHATQATAASRPVLSARYNILLATDTLSTQTVTTVATTYTIAFSGTGTVTLSGTATGTYSNGTRSITCTAGTLTLTVSGSVTNADLRGSNDGVGLPAYQRVDTATSYNTTGFPMYLKFDGVDDSLATGSIDFSATDKMNVFVGVRKASDAADGFIVGLCPPGSNGVFDIRAPGSSGTTKYQATAKGTLAVYPYTSSATYTAPHTAALAFEMEIGADIAKLRLNGTGVSSITTDQGTGTLGNLPLYIGRLNGTAIPFNGRIYSIIVRGAASDLNQVANAESWVNTKTRAY